MHTGCKRKSKSKRKRKCKSNVNAKMGLPYFLPIILFYASVMRAHYKELSYD